MAGVIKMVMALQHGIAAADPVCGGTVPLRRVGRRRGEAPQRAGGLAAPASVRRRAGVSSFGISGTNAHVILEEAPVQRAATGAADLEAPDGGGVRRGARPLPFLVSGSSEQALRAQAKSLASHLEGRPELELEAVAATLALGRAQLSASRRGLADDRDQLIARLRALSRRRAGRGGDRGSRPR